MKRVCFLTNYLDYLKSFSPLIITEDQLKMFIDNGYDPVVIATEGFDPPADSYFNKVELRLIHNVLREDEVKDANFESDVDMLAGEMKEHLKDIDVVITHDLLYLPDYTKYNLAARQVAKEMPHLRWLHWIHSCTAIDQLSRERQIYSDVFPDIAGKPFPNSYIVYPNTYDLPRIAKSFDTNESLMRCVPHGIDYCKYMKFEPETTEFVESKGLLYKDVIMVYPLRLDRGKQPHIVMEVAQEIKKMNKTVSVVFIDLQSNSKDPNDDKFRYRDEMKRWAKNHDLEEEVIFTSEYKSDWDLEVPRGVVADLMTLCNAFILPSMSETFSLVALEAEIKGASIVLNHDFPAMRSIYQDMAHYRKFSSNIDITSEVKDSDGSTETTYHPTRQDFMKDVAGLILADLNKNPLKGMTYFRKNNNLNSIFKNHIEPLMYEG